MQAVETQLITWPPGPELLEKENSTASLGTLLFTNWVAHVRASAVSCSVKSLEIIGGLGSPSLPWNVLHEKNKDLWNFKQLPVKHGRKVSNDMDWRLPVKFCSSAWQSSWLSDFDS